LLLQFSDDLQRPYSRRCLRYMDRHEGAGWIHRPQFTGIVRSALQS